jgi:tetratricopeptide (TPR) repeat protein
VAIVLCGIAFSNALQGGWVYDDRTQIVENRLVQDPRYYAKALLSDVWAFKGEKREAWSNYWRPAFTLWLIVNHQLFGANPLGWHVTSLVAHMVVTVLVFRVLRELKTPISIAALTTWVFAVHPVHSESVAWVSGVTDILLALFLLWAYLLHLRSPPHAAVTAPLLYALALLSKEAAIVFPVIIFATQWVLARDAGAGPGRAVRGALGRCLPFVAVAAVFVVVRYLVLHQMRTTAPNAPGLLSTLGTLPAVLVFYVRQAFVPVILGPDNAIRPFTNATMSLANFVLPIGVCLGLIELARRAWPRDAGYRFGLIWFLLPLALALDIRSFLPDQIVNNRYLYISVMGAWLAAGTAIHRLTRQSSARVVRGAQGFVYAAAVAVCAAMIPLTRDYNRAWGDEIALWERGTRSDPRSGHSYAQLGEAYRKAGRLDDAKQALHKALEIDAELTTPHIGLGIIAIDEGRYSDAERLLKTVLAVHPDYAVALEQLGACYQKQGRLDDAIAVFQRGAERMPYHRARYTMNVAVLHVMANRKADALAALESIREELAHSADSSVFTAWFYLGELYRESNRPSEALQCFSNYLSATTGLDSAEVRSLRAQCQARLAGGQPP